MSGAEGGISNETLAIGDDKQRRADDRFDGGSDRGMGARGQNQIA